MNSPQSKSDRVVDKLHYTKNVIGLVGFTALFLYCAYLLVTTSKPSAPLVYGILMFALLLTIIRSARRIVAIRRILLAGKK